MTASLGQAERVARNVELEPLWQRSLREQLRHDAMHAREARVEVTALMFDTWSALGSGNASGSASGDLARQHRPVRIRYTLREVVGDGKPIGVLIREQTELFPPENSEPPEVLQTPEASDSRPQVHIVCTGVASMAFEEPEPVTTQTTEEEATGPDNVTLVIGFTDPAIPEFRESFEITPVEDTDS